MQRKRFRNCKVTPPANYPNPCLCCGYSGVFFSLANTNCSVQLRCPLSVLNCTLTGTSPFQRELFANAWLHACLPPFKVVQIPIKTSVVSINILFLGWCPSTPNNLPLVSRHIQAHWKERRFIDSGRFLLEISFSVV